VCKRHACFFNLLDPKHADLALSAIIRLLSHHQRLRFVALEEAFPTGHACRQMLCPWRAACYCFSCAPVISSDRRACAVLISDEAHMTVLTAWQQRKRKERRHLFWKENTPLWLVPYFHAQMLARHLRGDLDAYPPWFWK
jgi:hypothetical protein